MAMRIVALLLFAAVSASAVPRNPVKLSLEPSDPLLFGRGSKQMLIAIARYSDGSEEDVTSKARFQSGKPAVATVDENGLVTAESNGGAVLRVMYRGLSASTTALVQRAEGPPPPSFNADVMPVLTKIGCNSGSCHGALNGQNGFKLSLFGYEPKNDYEMIVHKQDGRRLSLSDPEKSLLLLKPTFQVKHGGGKRFPKDSPDYITLLNWIRNGANSVPEQERRMVALSVNPPSNILLGKESKRRLLVTARYSDGSESDVTQLMRFQSNDDLI